MLQLQNGYVKSAQWRDALTFSWMPYTKSKRPTICWVPARRHLIPIPLKRHYRRNASRHHSPPQAGVGLVRLFIPLQCFQKQYVYHGTLWRAGSYLIFRLFVRAVWLNKGDLVSVTFSISPWRQTGKRSLSADWTWGGLWEGEGGLFETLLRMWSCWLGHLINTLTCLTVDYARITPQHPVTHARDTTRLVRHFAHVEPERN